MFTWGNGDCDGCRLHGCGQRFPTFGRRMVRQMMAAVPACPRILLPRSAGD